MKTLHVAIIAVAVTLSGLMTQAQTVDDIINKHIEALGGKEKIADINTVYTEYEMDIMGNIATGATWLINGKGYRNEFEIAGMKVVRCFTDKGGWEINPMAGQTTPQPLPEDQVKMGQLDLDPAGALFNYAGKGYKVELAGTETVNGVNAHKLILGIPDVADLTYLIDPNTYHISRLTIKSKSPGAMDGELKMTFSDYKKSEYGFVMPGTTEITMPMATFAITLKKMEINGTIDPQVFEAQ
jgi:hypothetical protein